MLCPCTQGLGHLGELAASFPGGPMLWALSRGPEALLTTLIDAGANPNLRDAGALSSSCFSVVLHVTAGRVL